MSRDPAVTVVVPTLGRRALLGTTLAGALRQRGVEVEVVLVHDGSDGDLGDSLGRCADPRVRLVRHELTLGVARARNAGIEQARGRWIAFLDDDDLWAPDKLREQLDAAARIDAKWVYSSVVLVDVERRPLELLPAPQPDSLMSLLLGQPTSAIPAGASNVCVRTEVVRRLGGFDESLFHLADWDLWIRLAQEGPPAACAAIHVAYVRHPQSMLVTQAERLLEEADRFFAKHADLAAGHDTGFDRLRFERWIASGHRRAGRRRAAAAVYLRGAWAHRNPANLVRAAGALIGERAWSAVRPGQRGEVSSPAWLRDYGRHMNEARSRKRRVT